MNCKILCEHYGVSAKCLGLLKFIERIVNVEKYQESAKESLLSNIKKFRHEQNFILQQDDAYCHIVRSIRTWLENLSVFN